MENECWEESIWKIKVLGETVCNGRPLRAVADRYAHWRRRFASFEALFLNEWYSFYVIKQFIRIIFQMQCVNALRRIKWPCTVHFCFFVVLKLNTIMLLNSAFPSHFPPGKEQSDMHLLVTLYNAAVIVFRVCCMLVTTKSNTLTHMSHYPLYDVFMRTILAATTSNSYNRFQPCVSPKPLL